MAPLLLGALRRGAVTRILKKIDGVKDIAIDMDAQKATRGSAWKCHDHW